MQKKNEIKSKKRPAVFDLPIPLEWEEIARFPKFVQNRGKEEEEELDSADYDLGTKESDIRVEVSVWKEQKEKELQESKRKEERGGWRKKRKKR